MQESGSDRGHLDELQNRRKGVSTSTLIGAIFATLLIGFVLGTRSDAFLESVGGFFGLKTTTDTVDLSDVQRTYRELKANYDGQLDKNALIDGASRGLVAAAGDRYTVFMDKKEAEEFQKELSGEVSGIGAEIGVRNS